MAKRSTLYVGGLVAQVTEEILHAAFIPFGEIRSVQIAKDYIHEGKSKGFGFVEYEFEEDCLAALENMDNSELYGKVLRCSIAKPMPTAEKGKGVWTSEEFLADQLKQQEASADDDDINYEMITK